MRSPLYLIFLLSLGSLGQTALTLPASDPSVQSLSDVGNSSAPPKTQNFTLGSTPPPIYPSNFTLSYVIGGSGLNETACFLNALNALKAMAILESEEPIVGTEGYQVPGATGTRVEVVPVGDQLERRFAMWGVYFGILEMWSKTSFVTTAVTLEWDGEIVGSVVFKNQQPSTTETTSVARRYFSGIDSRSSTRLSNVTGSANLAADESRCVPHFAPIGGPSEVMNFQDVIFPVLASLVDLSFFPSAARLDHEPDFKFRRDWFRLLQGFNGRIFVFERVRGEPPYLEYGDLIITLVNLVLYMLTTNRFGPTSISINVDDVKIGGGDFLERGTVPDPNLAIS